MNIATWCYFIAKRLTRGVRCKVIQLVWKFCFPRRIRIGKLAFGRGCVFDLDRSEFSLDIDRLVMRDYCTIRLSGGGCLRIGKDVFFNSFASLNSMESIEIGANSIFGENVRLYDHNHNYKGEGLTREQGFSTAPIVIGENCWIGSNVTILKGVSIGDNSVVGAGCLIFKDVPANMIVVSGQQTKMSPCREP